MSEIEAASAAVAEWPRVLHQGTYRLWEKADGTLHVSYQRDDQSTPDFFEIPGEMIRIMKAAENGTLNPMDMMKMGMKFMGGMGGQ